MAVTRDEALVIGVGVLLLAAAIAGFLYLGVAGTGQGGGGGHGGSGTYKEGLYYIDGHTLGWKSFADAVDAVLAMGPEAAVASEAEAAACPNHPPAAGYVATGRTYDASSGPKTFFAQSLTPGIFASVKKNQTATQTVTVQFTGGTDNDKSYIVVVPGQQSVELGSKTDATQFYKTPVAKGTFALIVAEGGSRGMSLFAYMSPSKSLSGDWRLRAADASPNIPGPNQFSTVFSLDSSSRLRGTNESNGKTSTGYYFADAADPQHVYSAFIDPTSVHFKTLSTVSLEPVA
jgi:hypothetical protein